MDYRYKVLLFLEHDFIVRDSQEKKYYLVQNVKAVVDELKAEHSTIEFKEYEDFDFGTTIEIPEETYLKYLKERD